jgi:acyl-CoA reductase-like NAD-dependent aldehyde dehydrogenase
MAAAAKSMQGPRWPVSERVAVLNHAADQIGHSNEKFAQRGSVHREPVGVVVAITPYNDPLNLVAHKVGPALAAGNAVIVKPHERTPLSALLLARALCDAGLPAGRLSVLPGGASVASSMITDARVRFVSFTGGRRVGALVHAAAGLKRTLMELGGICPTILMADTDLDVAVPALVDGLSAPPARTACTFSGS